VSPTTEPVLELQDVTKVYPGDPPLRALDGIDLLVRRGELAAIVGPSGSGKSTLLHIIGTLDRATSGVVRVAGRDTADLDDAQLSALRARELGFVFQQFFLLNGMTAVDNVADGLLYTGLPQAQRRARAVETLEAVGLGHRLGHDPNHLSGGERQRVAVARALVGEPSLVLADEPTGNLDSRSSASIMALLHEVHATGATILVITHDHEVAASLPRQVSLRDGRIDHDTSAAPVGPVDTGARR
jgi:putative ABC transport system ATP-binding protein